MIFRIYNTHGQFDSFWLVGLRNIIEFLCEVGVLQLKKLAK